MTCHAPQATTATANNNPATIVKVHVMPSGQAAHKCEHADPVPAKRAVQRGPRADARVQTEQENGHQRWRHVCERLLQVCKQTRETVNHRRPDHCQCNQNENQDAPQTRELLRPEIRPLGCTKSTVINVDAELSVESTLDMIAASKAARISPATPTGA